MRIVYLKKEQTALSGERVKNIVAELKDHAPFTLFGALTGIILMLVFRNLEQQISHKMFYIFHLAHVVLSAMVTASIFELYSKKPKLVVVVLVGFFGSIGIATLSDSLIPYLGELALGMHIEVHGHGHEPMCSTGQMHIGFIEAWQLVIPAAIAGSLIAYFKPKTKIPHVGHVLLSTWASSFHMLMAMCGVVSVGKLAGSFVFLFLAVWLPCCISDIVFPLLFVGGEEHISHH